MPNTNSIHAGGGLDWILAVKTDAERERKETLEGKKKIRKKKKKTHSNIYIYFYGDRDGLEKREGKGKIDVNMEEIREGRDKCYKWESKNML